MSFRRAALHSLFVLTTACAREEYGFVARLGNDTTSIERIERTGNRIVSDVVEQSPRVIRKHWEATLGDDGRMQRWTMERLILNPAPGEPADIHYDAEFFTDSVRVVQRTGRDTLRYTITNALPVTLPWEAFVYGSYELLFAAAAAQPGDSVPIAQLAPGYGQFQRGVIRKQPDGTLTLVTGGLAGTGVARLDERGRMLSYSGKHTTYKQEVERIGDAPDIDAIADRFAAHERTAPVRSLSVRDTMQATIGNATIVVDYGRPLARGREILGNVVPYNVVWRTGANAATQLSTSARIAIAGIDLAPGKYTLWTLPGPKDATLIINRQTGQWGTRYNARLDVGRAALTTAWRPQAVEQFTIRVEPVTADSGSLVLEWDRFRWSAPVVVP